MALVTGCAQPRYRGSFLSVCSSVQQAAAGLSTLIGGWILKEESHHLAGYDRVGLLACAATVASVLLIGLLRPADAEAMIAVDEVDEPGQTQAASDDGESLPSNQNQPAETAS
jgi:hypothetical protein